MVKILIFTLVSFFYTFSLAPAIINLLYRLQIREEIRKEGPKTHLAKEGTPTMAGILIVFAASSLNLLLNLSRQETYLPIFALLTGGLLGVFEDAFKIYRKSFLVGYFRGSVKAFDDGESPSFFSRVGRIMSLPWRVFKEVFRALGSRDDRGLKSYQKFIFQSAIGAFFGAWFYFKLGWDFIWLPLVGNIHLGLLYPFLVILLFVVFLNAVGLTDGLDGLAGGLLVLLFFSLSLISFLQNQFGLALFSASVAGSILAFLYFNFYPARVFMGNVGSHALGAAAFVVASILHREAILFVLGTLFLLEVLSVILQVVWVKLFRKRLFRMAPVHHHFELLGWPETKVVMRFWLLGVIFSLVGILLSRF